jgi:hypothetical protein
MQTLVRYAASVTLGSNPPFAATCAWDRRPDNPTRYLIHQQARNKPQAPGHRWTGPWSSDFSTGAMA